MTQNFNRSKSYVDGFNEKISFEKRYSLTQGINSRQFDEKREIYKRTSLYVFNSCKQSHKIIVEGIKEHDGKIVFTHGTGFRTPLSVEFGNVFGISFPTEANLNDAIVNGIIENEDGKFLGHVVRMDKDFRTGKPVLWGEIPFSREVR